MPVQDSLEAAGYQGIMDTVASVIQEYLTEARGEPVDGFTSDTPFMDAGLDSLDMLKANPSPLSPLSKPGAALRLSPTVSISGSQFRLPKLGTCTRWAAHWR